MVLLSAQQADAKAHRGLAWGTDNRWAKKIAKGSISWYHHWQNGPVKQMPDDVEFVPMFWGPKYKHLWEKRKSHFHKTKPKHVLAFNEPDVKGQANMSPKHAAKLFMKELEPLRKKGIKVSSPQIVWNTKWMDSFLKHLRARGGDVDFIAVHYYGSWKDLKRFKKWVVTVHKKYHKKVWVTEYGVTSKSGGSSGDIKGFMHKASAWMDKKSYVQRVAWLGCFAVNNPPDSFASNRNAMFSSKGSLRSIAYSYIYGKRQLHSRSEGSLDARSTPGAKRHNMQHHRRIISGLQEAADLSRRNESDTSINGVPASTEDVDDYLRNADKDDEDELDKFEGEEEECDELCKLRDEMTKDTELDEDDLQDDE